MQFRGLQLVHFSSSTMAFPKLELLISWLHSHLLSLLRTTLKHLLSTKTTNLLNTLALARLILTMLISYGVYFYANTFAHNMAVHVLHVHTHACTHAHIHARMHAHTHVRTHAYTHARTHARMHARTHACTHAHTHTQAAPMYTSLTASIIGLRKPLIYTSSLPLPFPSLCLLLNQTCQCVLYVTRKASLPPHFPPPPQASFLLPTLNLLSRLPFPLLPPPVSLLPLSVMLSSHSYNYE